MAFHRSDISFSPPYYEETKPPGKAVYIILIIISIIAIIIAVIFIIIRKPTCVSNSDYSSTQTCKNGQCA